MSAISLSRWFLACCAGMLLGQTSLHAASGEPHAVFRGIAHDMLYDLSLEGHNGVAVGDSGLIVETADGGLTWTRQAKTGTSLGLFGVVRKQGHCIATGQNGLIMSAVDCKQWTIAAPVTKARILSVAVNGAGTAYAVGGFGTLLKSTDWGKTWQKIGIDWTPFTSEGAEPHLYGVHVAEGGEVTLCGEFELILRSKDGGSSWQALRKGKRSLFGMSILANGEVYAVGQEGMILKSSDNGAIWHEQESGTQSILTGIWALPDGRVFASGIYTILASADGGKTWQMDGSRPARQGWHQAVTGSGEKLQGQQNILVVGSGGAILMVQR
ncbi:MAG: photosystem II stability/assembly factor-like protein [Betaproteobacteria bacterium]|nr:photosystem II stability/assembly factor-like protein [Betaproteobacteria bacterium]